MTHFGPSRPGETQFYARCAYSGIGLMETEEGLNALEAWGWS